jgi:hypothetical protein
MEVLSGAKTLFTPLDQADLQAEPRFGTPHRRSSSSSGEGSRPGLSLGVVRDRALDEVPERLGLVDGWPRQPRPDDRGPCPAHGAARAGVFGVGAGRERSPV